MVFICHQADLIFQLDRPVPGPVYSHVPAVPPLAYLSVVLSIASLHFQMQGEFLGRAEISKPLSVKDLLQP